MSWNLVTTPGGLAALEQLQQIAFDGTSRWVIGSNHQNTWYSLDYGNTWNGPHAMPGTLAGVYGLQFLNGLFYLWGPSTATGSNVYSSPDGVTWTQRATNANIVLEITGSGNGLAAAYGGGIYVILGNSLGAGSGSSLTSPDGVTWTVRGSYNPPSPNGFFSVCYDGTHFVAVTTDTGLTPHNQVGYSTDGATWTFQGLTTIPGPGGLLDGVSFFNGKYIVAAGYDATGSGQGWFEVATVLSPWNGTRKNLPTATEFPNPFLASDTSPLAIAWEINQSTNAISAISTADGVTYVEEPIPQFNGGFMEACAAGGAPGSWTQITTGFEASDSSWQLLGFGAGTWVIIATNPGVGGKPMNAVSSSDRVHWARNASGFGTAIGSRLAYGGSGGLFAFAATPPSGTGVPLIYTSPDGVTWTQQSPWGFLSGDAPVIGGSPGQFLAVAFNGQRYATSPDGITWTMRSTYTPTKWTSTPFWDGTRWIVGVQKSGGQPAIAYSTDGITFTESAALPSLTANPYDIAFDGTTYVLGDANDDTGIRANVLAGPWTSVSLGLAGGPADGGMAAGGGLFEVLSSNAIGASSPTGAVWSADTLPGSPGLFFAVTYGGGFFLGASSSTNFLMQRQAGGGFMAVGFNTALTAAVLVRTPSVAVPDVTGDTQVAAAAALTAAGLTLGTVANAYNSSVAAGLVFFQSPAAGTLVSPGSAVNITLSLGPQVVAVPDILGLSAAAANAALAGAGLTSGIISGVTDPATPAGDVSTQSPVAGTLVAVGSSVNYAVSFVVPQFDVDATVISQYANSPIILELVEDFGQYFDPSANLQNFYLTVWNIDTAEGFGLDIWGIILGVSRVVTIAGSSGRFGFENSDVPPDWENFGNINEVGVGGPFYSGQIVGNSYKLNDGPYRTLLLTKALANICATTPQALNALISNLFPGRGVCYTVDLGGMQMSYVFLFPLSVVEFAILADSGVLAHPAGVGVNVVVIQSGYLGFKEQGATVEPFNYGTFFN